MHYVSFYQHREPVKVAVLGLLTTNQFFGQGTSLCAIQCGRGKSLFEAFWVPGSLSSLLFKVKTKEV